MVYCPRNDRTPGHSPIHHKVQGLDYLYGFPAEGLGFVVVRVKSDGVTVTAALIHDSNVGIGAHPST